MCSAASGIGVGWWAIAGKVRCVQGERGGTGVRGALPSRPARESPNHGPVLRKGSGARASRVALLAEHLGRALRAAKDDVHEGKLELPEPRPAQVRAEMACLTGTGAQAIPITSLFPIERQPCHAASSSQTSRNGGSAKVSLASHESLVATTRHASGRVSRIRMLAPRHTGILARRRKGWGREGGLIY